MEARVLEALQAANTGRLEAPANPPAAGPVFLLEGQEDDLFEVGIEGVALNPNRK